MPGSKELVNMIEDCIGNDKKDTRNTMHADGFQKQHVGQTSINNMTSSLNMLSSDPFSYDKRGKNSVSFKTMMK